MRHYIFVFLILGNIGQVIAQTPLSIQTDNHCSFLSDTWEDDLYRFDDNALVEKWVNEILLLGGMSQNFQLIQTNVESVAAVVDNGRRYLFYSLDFVHKNKDATIYAALAHEMGHHLLEHSLDGRSTGLEESGAYFFMGYILSKKGMSRSGVTQLVVNEFEIDKANQMQYSKSVLDGFDKASRAVQLHGLAFDEGPQIDQLTLPTFEFKKCYANWNLPKAQFQHNTTLSSVDRQLQVALDKQGFAQRSYFSVKNGFALVTQMEQYNSDDATSRKGKTRWLEYPARDQFSSVWEYLTSILMPNNGYFRLFVFVVTDKSFKSSGSHVSKNEAAAWLSQGGNLLPKALADMPFTEGYNISVLVYEFEVPESNHVAEQICPTPRFDARTHLMKAGIVF